MDDDDAGCDTSVLSRLGVAVRRAIHPLATSSEGQLVSIIIKNPSITRTPLLTFALCLLRVSMFFGNTLYLVALGYYTIICFLGYNGKSPPPRPVPSILPSFQPTNQQANTPAPS